MSSHGCNKYKKHDWPIDKIQQWIEVEKKTHVWVAEQIGCGNQHVSRICKKHGIKTQPGGSRPGKRHTGWKGGEIIDKDGYHLAYCLGHPHARKPRKKYVLKHRLIMEHHIGRYLLPDEVVHHKNKDKDDNRIENLVLYSVNSEHLKDELNGKIPNWTHEGRQRILDGVQKWRDSRKALKLCAHQTP